MSSTGHLGVSELSPRSSILAKGEEKVLTVLAAPIGSLTSVMRRSEVAVGKCVGRQDFRRKRGTSGSSAGELYRAEISHRLWDFESATPVLFCQLLKYYATVTILSTS